MKWIDNMTESIRWLLGKNKVDEVAKPDEHRKLVETIKDVRGLLDETNMEHIRKALRPK